MDLLEPCEINVVKQSMIQKLKTMIEDAEKLATQKKDNDIDPIGKMFNLGQMVGYLNVLMMIEKLEETNE